MGDLLGGYASRLDPKGRRFQARAVDAWYGVAGDEVRKHTRGLALRDGELVVHVDSPVWATQLSLLSERFRKEINAKLDEELVMKVRFDVSKRVRTEAVREEQEQAEEAFYAPDPVMPVNLSEVERRQVEYCAAAIGDEEVRDAAIRLMTKDLEWKKGIRLLNESQRASQGPERANPKAE